MTKENHSTRRLRNLLTSLQNRREISNAEGLEIFILLRKHLESTKSRDQFKNLAFYCDWLVHSEMNRKKSKEILRRMSYAISENLNSNDGAILSVQKIIKPAAFIIELESLLTALHPTSEFSINYDALWVFLICEVMGSPIQIPLLNIMNENGTLNRAKIINFLQIRAEPYVLCYSINFQSPENEKPAKYVCEIKCHIPKLTTGSLTIKIPI